jgi:hypothetical protein
VFPLSQGIAWHFYGSHNAVLDACLYAGVFGGLFYACFLVGSVWSAALLFVRQPARGGTVIAVTVFWVLAAMTDPFLLRWPYSSHVVLLALAAGFSSGARADGLTFRAGG